MNLVFESIRTFATEGVRLVGWGRIGLGLGAVAASALVAGWVGARLLARENKPFMSALGASLFLLLIILLVGSVYVAGTIKNLLVSPEDASTSLTFGCTAIAGVLTLMGVHGAFGTPIWKSAVLLVLVVGAAGGAAYVATPMIFPEQPAQLQLLANQVTGRTSEGPWLVESAVATKKIEARRAVSDRDKLLIRQGDLGRVYQELQIARTRLNVKDAAAVNAFNARAAAYATEVQKIKTQLAALQIVIDSAPVEKSEHPEKHEDDEDQ